MKNKVQLIVLLMLISGTNLSTANDTNLYGGIAGNSSISPYGTVIDLNMTRYYQIPTAVGNGHTYWFVGGWGWFNETEMMNLPPSSLLYDMSPYDCETYGCGGSDRAYIEVPISSMVIISFIGFVSIYMWRKR